MFAPITNFVKRRHRGLAVAASVVGGSYLLLQYAKQRFQDLSEKLVLDRAAKENLRRRFQQNQEDCAFTLLALLPTLSQQVLEELDVEAITAELQRRSNERAKTSKALPESHDGPNMQDSQDLLDRSSHDLTQKAANIPLPPEVLEDGLQNDQSGSPAQLMNGHSSAEHTESEPAAPVDTRTKAELWQALKLTTFHRTIASLYLLALLALQTHIQLNLLGRHNYVSSIYKQASHQSSSSSSSLDAEEDDLSTTLNGSAKPDQGRGVHAQAEREYLSMSWWFLQRGWRTVSQRIEDSAEESLSSVGLKSLLSHQDLNKLLLEIRRKIEYEANGAVHSFAPSLFPSTEKEEQETLHESGLAFEEQPTISPQLRSIMSETRDFIDSADFSVVLRSCLDKLFALLSESLGHLFVDDAASPASQAAQRRFVEVSEKKVRLAAVLPALARASHTIFNGVPNEYAEALADNRELMEFSVVVYSNFQQQ